MNGPANGKPPIWNLALYQAARKSGCTKRQAEVLAVYVETDSLPIAAAKLGISHSTAKGHLLAVRQRFKLHHTSAVVARLMSP